MDRSSQIIRTSWIGIIANVLLAAFKAGVGVLASSVAIVMDAVNNLSDALSSVITIIGTMVVNLLTGSLAIESIFSIPGIGGLFTDSVKNNDYNVIMGLTILYSFMYMLAILITDIAYSLVDPRIRIAAGKGGD